MADIPERIAIVYDRVNKWGGAERVLQCLHELFPTAPLFTAVYNKDRAEWAKVFPEVIHSFLQYFPKAASRHELYPWLTPLAFESFNFDNYDAVISVTSADAKGIITKPHTFHVCYCLTPTRYLWSHEKIYRDQLSAFQEKISNPVFKYLKEWDRIASQRPDAYISISQTVRQRVKEYYNLESEVVYPPVDVNFFQKEMQAPALTDYFLWVGRLVNYKRTQVVIEVFNELKLPLVVIGLGELADKLQQMAAENIYFLGHQSDEELSRYYQHAKALVFFHEEDFGIIPVEAMAAGTAIVGLRRGGVSETVVSGITGELIEDSNPQYLKNAILRFDRNRYDRQTIKSHVQKFSKERFKEEFLGQFLRLWKKHPAI